MALQMGEGGQRESQDEHGIDRHCVCTTIVRIRYFGSERRRRKIVNHRISNHTIEVSGLSSRGLVESVDAVAVQRDANERCVSASSAIVVARQVSVVMVGACVTCTCMYMST